jgi:threonine/homoserine/homoserine lactone efflux protein
MTARSDAMNLAGDSRWVAEERTVSVWSWTVVAGGVVAAGCYARRLDKGQAFNRISGVLLVVVSALLVCSSRGLLPVAR